MTDEQWQAFFTTAKLLNDTAVAPGPIPAGVRGRFLAILVDRVCEFWAKHQNTLIPFLSQLAIASLNALLAARVDIDNVNNPGPQ